MDSGDRWRVLTCSQDKTIMNRIMLRFRPIAPKPVTDGSSSTGGWKPENQNVKGLVSSKRTKRKYVRVKKRNEYHNEHRNKKKTPLDLEEKKMFTLQLLPEKADDPLVKDLSLGSCGSSSDMVDRTVRIDDVHQKEKMPFDFCEREFVKVVDRTVFETVVTVESATATCMDEVVAGDGGGGCTDVERMNNLEEDTCPGFIADESSRVQWVNEAYKKMVTLLGRPEKEGQRLEVKLVIKEKVLPYLYSCAAFTCWVRLQYTWQKEKYSQMVPCDVWKMSFGGYAWRLDVKAALSLGL